MGCRNYFGKRIESLGRKIKRFVIELALNYSNLKTPELKGLQEPYTGLARLTASLDSAYRSGDVQQVIARRVIPIELLQRPYHEETQEDVEPKVVNAGGPDKKPPYITMNCVPARPYKSDVIEG